MNVTTFKPAIALTLSLSIIGCTSIDPYTGDKDMSGTSIATGVGTVGGAIVGSLIDGRTGAIVGGVMGAAAGGLIGSSLDRESQELRQRLVGTGVQVQKVGNSIQLVMASDVTFAFNQASIQAHFYQVLDSVAIVLKKYNKTSITISGFTDNTGSDAYNQILSEKRAQSVGAYLISHGISPNRIFAQGLGKRHPIASNATATGRQSNRCVVITLRPLN